METVNNISFPSLGIDLTVSNVAFHIFSHPIYWYALIILFGFGLAVLFVGLTAKKRGVKPENILDIGIYGLFVGIICARIYYVIFAWDEFAGDPMGIFRIWEGGLAIYGGIIGAIITAVIYCRIKKLNTLNIFDVCAPGLLIGQAVGRFGNFVNAEVYGRATSLPWGMSINGAEPVHPLFLYESLWNILGFIIILLFRDRKKADGQVFFFYIAWYSFGRFFLEGLRPSQYILYMIPDVLAASQVVAVIGVIAGITGIIIVQARKKQANNNAH